MKGKLSRDVASFLRQACSKNIVHTVCQAENCCNLLDPLNIIYLGGVLRPSDYKYCSKKCRDKMCVKRTRERINEIPYVCPCTYVNCYFLTYDKYEFIRHFNKHDVRGDLKDTVYERK